MPSIEIVCLSRARPENMETIFSVLPGAVVTVDEGEVEEYAKFCDRGQIIPHPPMSGAPAVRNWILANTDADVVVMVDDDFRGVRVNVGSFRYTTDPGEILQIIHNAAQNSLDVGVNVFGFSRTENVIFLKSETEPIKAVHPIYGLIGVIGSAKTIRFDEQLKSRADLDWCMQVLHKERAVYADTRFYFDFGESFTGRGGNSGLVGSDDFRESMIEVKKRWGKHVKVSGPSLLKNRSTSSASIRVARKNKTAAK